MAKAAAGIDYVAELLCLRTIYPSLTPRQRLSIIRQRLRNHDSGPNRLVTSVSAVEGLARSLVMHVKARDKADLKKLYNSYKDRSPKTLVADYLKAKGMKEPSTHFGADTWRLFCHAVDFRNLLAHECTYLGQDKYPSLIKACEEVLENLAKQERILERQTLKAR